MRFSMTPDTVFDDFGQITPEYLRRRGVKLLLSDLDYTLAAKSTRTPPPAVQVWIDSLRQAGITFMIVSNNRSGRRVTDFCAQLGVPYQGHAKKPSPKGLEAAIEAGRIPWAVAMNAPGAKIQPKIFKHRLAQWLKDMTGQTPVAIEPEWL